MRRLGLSYSLRRTRLTRDGQCTVSEVRYEAGLLVDAGVVPPKTVHDFGSARTPFFGDLIREFSSQTSGL